MEEVILGGEQAVASFSSGQGPIGHSMSVWLQPAPKRPRTLESGRLAQNIIMDSGIIRGCRVLNKSAIIHKLKTTPFLYTTICCRANSFTNHAELIYNWNPESILGTHGLRFSRLKSP